MQYSRKKNANESRIIFNFKPQTNDSYYLELPGDIDDNSVDMSINGTNVDVSVRDQNTRLINLGSRQCGQRIQIVFTLKNNDLNLNAANLWRLDTNKLEHQIATFKKQQPRFKQISALVIKSNNFTTTKNMTMNSTIPYNYNWLVLDNHKIVHKNKTLFMNTFLSFKLTKGQHQITLIYIPWVLLIGLLVTLITSGLILKIKK